mmetsp:Transcript_70427/g.146697  ORF Transcript_70427/g.146697 Transcript_70427/m.146697 type:complete len:202 (-) Transcript_70427:260-865(-)
MPLEGMPCSLGLPVSSDESLCIWVCRGHPLILSVLMHEGLACGALRFQPRARLVPLAHMLKLYSDFGHSCFRVLIPIAHSLEESPLCISTQITCDPFRRSLCRCLDSLVSLETRSETPISAHRDCDHPALLPPELHFHLPLRLHCPDALCFYHGKSVGVAHFNDCSRCAEILSQLPVLPLYRILISSFAEGWGGKMAEVSC